MPTDFDIIDDTDQQEDEFGPSLKRFLKGAGVGLQPPYDIGVPAPTASASGARTGVTVQPVVTRKAELPAGADAMSGVKRDTPGVRTTIPAQGDYELNGAGLMVPKSGPSLGPTMKAVFADAEAQRQRSGSGDFLNTSMFSGGSGSPSGAPSTSAPSTKSDRPGIGRRIQKLQPPTEPAGEVEAQQAYRQANTPLNRQDPRYKLSGWGRVGRAVASLATGGIPGLIENAVDPNSRLSYGRGAVGGQYFADEDAQARNAEAAKNRISSYEAEDKLANTNFNDAFKLQRDDELSEARQENADTRKQLSDLRAQSIDPKTVEQNDSSPTGWYGYRFGDTDRKDPIPFTPKGYQKAPPAPRTYDEMVLALESERDPGRRAVLQRAIKHIEDTEQKRFRYNPSTSRGAHLSAKDQLKLDTYMREHGIESQDDLSNADVEAALGRGGPSYTRDQASFEGAWRKRFDTVERKYNAERQAVLRSYGADRNQNQYRDNKDEIEAKFRDIEARREEAKADLQQQKDDEARQYQVYSSGSRTKALTKSGYSILTPIPDQVVTSPKGVTYRVGDRTNRGVIKSFSRDANGKIHANF